MADTASTGVISGAIKWTGLSGSGTDFASVVESLVAIEQRTVTRQQTWQSQWQEKLTAINQLDTRLNSLKLNARDYDTRSELLSRAASSSKPEVATITNTSTASTGVYSVDVGENVVEKLASKTYKKDEPIGGGASKDASGNFIDANGLVIGTNDPSDAGILNAVTEKLNSLPGQPQINGVTFAYDASVPPVGYYYDVDSPFDIVARIDDVSEAGKNKIFASGGPNDGELLAATMLNNKNSGRDEIVLNPSGHTVPIDNSDPDNGYYPPIIISMGGKELKIDYKAGATSGEVGYYNENFTMDDLMKTINNSIAADPDNTPDLKAELLYDKTRNANDEYYRLILTGNVGGVKNHITVSDPTDLCMDRNSIDDPVTASWASQITPQVDPSSSYTGHVNKTITVMVSEGNGGYELGVNTVVFNWADTEGKTGKFTISPSMWDSTNNCLKEPIELTQGVKINLQGQGGGIGNTSNKSQAFTIDCQAPVMQKAADIGLAQTDKWVHQGFVDQITPVNIGGGGVFAYTYAGKEYTVNLSTDVGLQGLVDKINSDSKNPGVMASILNDGMGTATSYKLVLTGYHSGAEHAITISDKTSLNRMPCKQENFTHAREASNSMSRIDGYPNDGESWIQRATNEVSDVLDGVVLTLQGTGTTNITIQNNVSDMVDKIKQLIESVNFCKSYIKEQTKYGTGKVVSKWNEKTQMFERTTETGKDPSGVMIGNYGFQMAQSAIDNLMTKQIISREDYINAIDPKKELQGLYPLRVDDEERDGPSQEGIYQAYMEENGLIYNRLSDLGIASNPDQQGQYMVAEESKLVEALSKNPEAVIKLFTFTPADTFPKDKPFDDEDARPRIGGFAVMLGYAMSDMTRSTDDIDSKTGEVIRPGKGITKVLAENYANIISGIDVKIERENRRIAMVRSRLEDKFARLETLLASLDNQSTKIEAQLKKLNGE